MRCDDMRRRRARAHACNTRTFDDAGVCREWRCKYTGDKTDSVSLEAISKVVDEYLPQLKAMEGATVNRLVCGSCLDFKLMTTVPLDAYGPWEASGHAPEAEFIEKLNAIEGVCIRVLHRCYPYLCDLRTQHRSRWWRPKRSRTW